MRRKMLVIFPNFSSSLVLGYTPPSLHCEHLSDLCYADSFLIKCKILGLEKLKAHSNAQKTNCLPTVTGGAAFPLADTQICPFCAQVVLGDMLHQQTSRVTLKQVLQSAKCGPHQPVRLDSL